MTEFNFIPDWCKVFVNTDGSQTLVTKDFDSDSEKYIVRIESRFEIEGAFINPSINMSYDTESDMIERFNSIDPETAERCYKELYRQIEEMLA